ncbi:hypothetical protein SERLA73DRAFT_192060 [Serpula lacrymans var. lacrymans S7.3]|uniref:mitogen-activated protein kinase kinase n=2 Tax=Serpula lacrymans var. lacrymans TaxID=341189 RepID=F8QIV3_SERL3|nr:uncharacterized protein SERLADRAFT_465153 [Serpula lacrymans var. lacrymans S7.9]EGN91759.1 hypothetical protein SERLA73DRAFT_192060 [Serpula lacrymans var. lacrymans S7.3]EGO25271.1 hypothetical protein SERLADRAFT_465153 [Serpula lacrymans var. lacrymans S7.9]
MGELQLDEELGRGNYGTVRKVLHKPTKVAMAMKEIRLELDSSKLNSILMELDILHRARSPTIVDFYGAFFLESCVYYCMEYMDAGSLDRLQPGGITEHVLARIASRMVKGLKWLKDEMQIIHRDVKPTNVLVNRKGEVKLCDFGVSGQLEKSLAKTNIGCQSYMAPERIKGSSASLPEPTLHGDAVVGGMDEGSYSVASDVWSLGLSVVEVAKGKYPYPPETYENVFAQLSAIVDGVPPGLPEDEDEPPATSSFEPNGDGDNTMTISTSKGKERRDLAEDAAEETGDVWRRPRRWTPDARNWVARCLVKRAEERATYAELLAHPWLVADAKREVDMVGWVVHALEWKDKHGTKKVGGE